MAMTHHRHPVFLAMRYLKAQKLFRRNGLCNPRAICLLILPSLKTSLSFLDVDGLRSPTENVATEDSSLESEDPTIPHQAQPPLSAGLSTDEDSPFESDNPTTLPRRGRPPLPRGNVGRPPPSEGLAIILQTDSYRILICLPPFSLAICRNLPCLWKI